MSWIVENYAVVLEALGALSVAAALVAKLTPNTTDDSAVAKFKKALDFVSLSVRKK